MTKRYTWVLAILLALGTITAFAYTRVTDTGPLLSDVEAEDDVVAGDDVTAGDDAVVTDDIAIGGKATFSGTDARIIMPECTPVGTPSANTGYLQVEDATGTTTLYFLDNAGNKTNLLDAGSATKWDDIGDPDADGTVAFAGYKQTLSSTLNSAGGVLTMTNTTADLTADVSFIDLKLTDDGDANGYFLRLYDNSGGDLKYSIGADGKVTITGTAEGTDAMVITGGDLTLSDGDVVLTSGDLSVTGNFSLTGSFYQSAIAAAASGNVNLTIDAAGSGTITLGGTSTGKITTDNTVELFGATDIGDAGTDTLTITSSIDGNVTLDDGVTHSPQLILKDATDETAIFQKQDGDDFYLTLAAGRDFEIVTGNLAVGNGSPGTCAMDGQDFYVTGDVEIDGTTTHDGAVTLANDITITDQIAATFADNAEELDINASADNYAADAAIATLRTSGGAGATNNTYLLRLRHAAKGDAQDHFFVCEDNAGDDKLAVNSGGTTTWTLDAGAKIAIDGDTTNSTNTGGALDIDVGSATDGGEAVNVKMVSEVAINETSAAITIDLDDDTAAAASIYGIDIASSDGTGSSVLYGINFQNSLETDIKAATAAGGTFLTLDSATADSTVAAGVMDIAYDTITDTAHCIDIDMGVSDPAGAVTVGAIKIDLDDDTNTQPATIDGVAVTSSDLTGNASSAVRAFYTSGCDVALQADNGYVRIGTGSTPDVTPGDDDLYVEGTAEIDGAVRIDGSITGDGGDAIKGYLKSVTDDTDDEVLAITGSGGVYTNAGDGDAETYSLPDAAAGLEYTFVVMAAQQLRIDPKAGDKIIYAAVALDNGEYLWADAVGESIHVLAVDGVNWIVTQSVGTWTQETP